jgi:hypothetical protein
MTQSTRVDDHRTAWRSASLLLLLLLGVPVAVINWNSNGEVLLLLAGFIPLALGVAGCRPKLMTAVWFPLCLLILLPAGCSLVGSAPQLLLDPITAKIYRARDRQPVEIGDDLLPRGATLEQTAARLLKSGFKPWATYEPSNPVGEAKLQMGLTHAFARGGGVNWFCGKRLFVEVGVSEGRLTKVEGKSTWTCL